MRSRPCAARVEVPFGIRAPCPAISLHLIFGVCSGRIAAMGTATKAELETQVKQLQRALAREKAQSATRDTVLERAKGKNQAQRKALGEGRAREKATAEILRVIRNSPGDAQPVFDAIARAAFRLVGEVGVVVTRIVGDSLHLAALTSNTKNGVQAVQRLFPRPLSEVPLQHRRA